MWYLADNLKPSFRRAMKTQLLTQLSKYLETTPAYEPRGEVGEVLSRLIIQGKEVVPDGSLPSYQSDNEHVTGNGGGFSDAYEFEVPYGKEKDTGKQVVLTAICTVTMTVDDWGSAYIDGTKVVDMTEAIEPGGEYGGHRAWTRSGRITLKSGRHTLTYESTNISDYPNPEGNVSVKGKTVAFNSQFIEGSSNYTSTASSMINAAFDEMKQQKIYGKKMYTVNSRSVKGEGFATYVLGDYSMGGAFLLEYNERKCEYTFIAEIYTYDVFNADAHSDLDNEVRTMIRNGYAWVLKLAQKSTPGGANFVTRTKNTKVFYVKRDKDIHPIDYN